MPFIIEGNRYRRFKYPRLSALIRHRLGLDQPIWQQYGNFVWRALHGDLGYDYYHQIPVNQIIVAALPKTLSLVLGAAVLWMALGLFNGIVSARRPRSSRSTRKYCATISSGCTSRRSC